MVRKVTIFSMNITKCLWMAKMEDNLVVIKSLYKADKLSLHT